MVFKGVASAIQKSCSVLLVSPVHAGGIRIITLLFFSSAPQSLCYRVSQPRTEESGGKAIFPPAYSLLEMN